MVAMLGLRLFAWMASLALALCVAAACSGDDSTSKTGDTTPSAQVCPAAIDGSAVWSYDGDDSQCAELAATFTAQADDDDPSDAEQDCAKMLAAFKLTPDGSNCRATLAATCEARSLAIECDVKRDGAADCTATIRAAELEAGSCDLELVISGGDS